MTILRAKTKKYIGESIEITGVIALEVSKVTIRVVGNAKPLMQWKMERELRMSIKLALDKNRINVSLDEKQLDNENIEKDGE